METIAVKYRVRTIVQENKMENRLADIAAVTVTGRIHYRVVIHFVALAVRILLLFLRAAEILHVKALRTAVFV